MLSQSVEVASQAVEFSVDLRCFLGVKPVDKLVEFVVWPIRRRAASIEGSLSLSLGSILIT